MDCTPSLERSDRDLLRAWVEQRDEQAYALVVGRYGDLVTGVTRRILGSATDADDAVQAVFLVLLRRAPDLLDHTNLASWLHRTATQVALTAREAATARERREGTRLEHATEPQVEPPAPELAHSTDLDLALGELPERYRATLLLVHGEGLTQHQVASRLGVPRATIATWLTRGRNQLRSALARRGIAVGASAIAGLSLLPAPAHAASPALLAQLSLVPQGNASAAACALAQTHVATPASSFTPSGILGMSLFAVSSACLIAGASLLWPGSQPTPTPGAQATEPAPAPAPVTPPPLHDTPPLAAERIWQRAKIPNTESCQALAFDPADPERLVLGTRPGGLWESLDAGNSWSQVDSGLPSGLRYGFNTDSIVMHPRIPNLWFAGIERHGAYRNRDAGRTWTRIANGLGTGAGLNGICFAFVPADDRTIFYGSDGGLYKSTDQGDHWTQCTAGLPLPDAPGGNTTVQRLAVDPASGAVFAAFYAVGRGQIPGIYVSHDNGATWQSANQGIATGPDEEFNAAIVAQSKRLDEEGAQAKHPELNVSNFFTDLAWTFDLRLIPETPSVLFAATQRWLYRSDDGGKLWKPCPSVQRTKTIALDPQDRNTIAAWGPQQLIWVSRDQGLTWQDRSHGLNQPPRPANP